MPWVNSLWLSDTIWWHRTGSTLVHVMAWCPQAPSHYLNQCWLIISQVRWQSCEGNSQEIPQPSITKISLKIPYLKFHSNLPGVNELMSSSPQLAVNLEAHTSPAGDLPWSQQYNNKTYTHTLTSHTVNSLTSWQNDPSFCNVFRCIFENEKFCIFIKISLKFIPKGAIGNNPALV